MIIHNVQTKMDKCISKRVKVQGTTKQYARITAHKLHAAVL